MAEDTKPARADEEILEEIRDRYSYATQAWKSIREEGQKDMRYIAGDCWDADARAAREKAKRPVLNFDELSQYVNQLINDVRQNKRGIKVSPQGAGANDETADLRQNLIRQIEYRSNAHSAYTTMFENAVQRSYGYLRVKPRYENDQSFDQELVIEAIENPDLVTLDPDAVKPDGSDAQFAFVTESMSRKDFKRRFPRAEVHDFTDEHAKDAPGWVDGERVRVAEYWTIERKRRRLLLLAGPTPQDPPIPAFEDELPEGTVFQPGQVARDRFVDVPYVCQYLTNGVELLANEAGEKKTPWPGRSIPLVQCLGKVIYGDFGSGSERRILSLVRLARDPQMLYAYYRTCEAELVGMTPKTPFIGYEGQFRGHEDKWQRVAAEPVAYLEAAPTTEKTGQQILPLPQRQPYDPPIQSLEVGAESARRGIQAAMGTTPLPTQAQRRNEKSGIALQRMEDSAQRGSYHFIDHYDDSIRRVGELIDELLPHYYDAARDVTTRLPDDSPKVVRINDEQAPDGLRSVAQGVHDVTISVGPAFASQREEAASFAEALMSTPMAPMVADLLVKVRQLGPIGDEIAERLTPPQFQKKDGPPTPAMVAQLQQQLQQMQQALQQAQQFIATEQAKQQAIIEKTQIEAQRDIKLEEMRGQIELAKAELEARIKGAVAQQQVGVKVAEISADAIEAERDRQHETELEARRAQQAQQSQHTEHAHAAGLAAQTAAAKAKDGK